jgi:5-methylthioadenosine/S-adenosylhomocysteine deaminase
MDTSAVGRVLADGMDDISRWEREVDSGRLAIGLAPHGPYTCHPRLFQAVAEAIGDSDRHVAIHLAGSRDEYDFVKYGSSPLAQDFRLQSGWENEPWMPTGVSPVRYVYQWGVLDLPNVLAVHCVHVDAEDIDVLQHTDVAVAHCPRCNAKLGMGTAPLGEFIAHGLRVGLGTDSPASNSTIDFFEEMRVGLLIQRSLRGEQRFFTSRTFIDMATLGAARALKLDHLVGTLEPGKRADVIVVSMASARQTPMYDPISHLVYVTRGDDVRTTVVNGKILMRDRKVLTLNEADVLAEARAFAEKVRAAVAR